MRKALFLTTAITALVYASGGWAQEHQERGPAAGPGEKLGAPAQGEKMAPRRDEHAAPANGPATKTKDEGDHDRDLKTDTDRKAEPKGAANGRQDAGEQDGGKQDAGKQDAGEQQPAARPRDAARPEGGEGGAAQRTGSREGRAAHISSEQRSRVQSSLHGVNVREAKDIDVATVRVGESLPRRISTYWEPAPAELISIVPEWRDYRIVRIRDEILVIDPETYEIVFVIS